jgi:hypothetical protein
VTRESKRLVWGAALLGMVVLVSALLRHQVPTPATGPARVEESLHDLRAESREIDSSAEEGRSPAGPRPPPLSASTPTASGSIRLHGKVESKFSHVIDANVVMVIALTDRDGNEQETKVSNGSYQFDRLAPGSYFLQVVPAHTRPAHRTITLKPDEDEHVENFLVEDTWLLGFRVVTPNGQELLKELEASEPDSEIWPWLTVAATIDSPGDRLPEVDWDQAWSGMEGLPICGTSLVADQDKKIEIFAEPPIYVSVAMRDLVLATTKVVGRVESVELVVDPAKLRTMLGGLTLIVLDGETGAPAMDASVHLRTSESSDPAIHPDDTGHVKFDGRVPGRYELEVAMAARGDLLVDAEVAAGHVTDLGTVRLGPEVRIRGRCIDEKGAEQSDVLPVVVQLREVSQRRAAITVFPARPAAESAGFVFRGLPAGRYEIQSTPVRPSTTGGDDEGQPGDWHLALSERHAVGWIFDPKIIDTRSGPVDDLVLTVRHPSSIFIRPVSEAVDGMDFEIQSAGGVSVLSDRFHGSMPTRIELAPGDYRLTLSRLGTEVRESAFTLHAEPLTLDIEP